MHFDQDGRVKPYATKKEWIRALENALARIEHASTLDQAVEIARSMRRTDRRWRGDSPRAYDKVKEAEERGQ